MMIFERCNDISTLLPEMIIHPVNCTGLGRDALSRHLKRTWPDYFREYTRACLRKKLQVAQAIVHEQPALFGTRIIVTLPVKNHWQEPLRPPQVKEALEALSTICARTSVRDMAMPELVGPPPGWLEAELARRLACAPLLERIFLFCDE